MSENYFNVFERRKNCFSSIYLDIHKYHQPYCCSDLVLEKKNSKKRRGNAMCSTSTSQCMLMADDTESMNQ